MPAMFLYMAMRLLRARDAKKGPPPLGDPTPAILRVVFL